jgi:phosphopantetheinyl transferase (holo-ACP synthase)
MMVMVAVFVGCSILLFNYSFNTKLNRDAEQKKVDQVNQRIAAFTVQHQVDPRTEDYHAFVALVEQLKNSRRDWTPIFELITKNLYKSSRLLTMEVNDKDVMLLHLEFASLKEAAYYTVLLQNSTLLEKVSVQDISISKKSKGMDKTAVSQMEAGKTAGSIQTSTVVSYSVSLEILLKSLVSGK